MIRNKKEYGSSMGVLPVLVFILLSGLALVQFRIVLLEQKEFSAIDDQLTVKEFRLNPRLLTWKAKQLHIFDADFISAERYFQQALRTNPSYIPAWLGLAELRRDQGQPENSASILAYVDQLSENINRWRKDKALVAYQLGLHEMLAKDLAYIVRNIPMYREDASRLALSAWEDVSLLSDRFDTDILVHVFHFLVSEKRIDDATLLWEQLDNHKHLVAEKDIFSYLELLMSRGELDRASTIWKDLYNPDEHIFNGAFLNPPLQRAFGWRIFKVKGVTWEVKTVDELNSQNALFVKFNGKRNVPYHHLQQIVPLKPGGTYQFNAELKTKGLTTDQRPFLEIFGFKCEGLYHAGEMVAYDQEWQNNSLEFIVPEECRAVVVRLKRKESISIDNKIAGNLWLRNVKISELSQTSSGYVEL